MSDWQDGEIRYVQGSGAKPYKLLRRGEVYSCSCPARTRQSKPIDLRTCKHNIAQRGRAVEDARTGGKPAAASGGGTDVLAAPAVVEVAARSGEARGNPATGQIGAAAREKARHQTARSEARITN
jgi:hypothetical protein